MNTEALYGYMETGKGESESFLELSTNRLARDLFLLTAVYALFLVMFLAASFRIAADKTWAKEGRVVDETAQNGLVLSLHLRKDGRIQVAKALVTSPKEAAAAVGQLIKEKPALRDAKVIVNTWSDTPSVRTSDLTTALAGAGLDPKRLYIRFTEE